MGFTSQQIDVIKRCQQSANFFLRNFGKIKHPSAGILPFYPFSYQRQALKAFRENRLCVFRKCRQAGVSKIAGAFALWFSMFYSNKKILIVSRKNDDAMGFLRDNIVFPYNNLPEWMKQVWEPRKINEHEIVFPNNSHIQSLTSHPDVLRSHASSLNILDEVAFIPQMDAMWAAGWPCCRGDTLVQTSDGLFKIEELAVGGDPWKDISVEVATDEGYKLSNKAYVSGRKPTVKINTYLGLEFEGAEHHQVRVIDGDGAYIWKQLDEIKPDDIIVSVPGTYRGKRRVLSCGIELNEKIAEVIGLYVGDGSLSIERPKRLRIFFDPQDVATRDRMILQCNEVFSFITCETYPEFGGTTQNLRINSAELSQWFVDNGLNSKTCPQDAHIPSIILQSDEPVLCAFLRGLFDSDGWCYPSSTCLKLGLSTTSKKLAEQVQVCLHSLGILSRRKLVDPQESKNEDRFSDEPYWRVDVWDSNSKLVFRQKIGFITERKKLALDSFSGSNEYSELQHFPLVREFANELIIAMLNGQTFRSCNDHRKWNIYRIAREGRVRLSLVRELTTEFSLTSRLSEYVKKGFHFDTVITIGRGEAELFDLSVPSSNTYLANGIVSHNTLQHGGSVIAISTCVAPDTLVMTADGLYEIQDLAPSKYDGFDDGYYHANYNGPDITGINGLEKATKFYKRPKEATKIITTSCGYKFEASLLHKLPIVLPDGTTQNRYIKDLNIGDFLPVKAGQMVFGDKDTINYVDRNKNYREDNQDAPTFRVKRIDKDLAYLLGVIIAEGHVREYGRTSASVTLACGDVKVLDRCESWGDLRWNRGRKGQDYVTICYTPMFVRFLKYLGVECVTAPFKTIPKRLLQCSEPIIKEFLKGLFDGDGSAATRQGVVCYSSTSYKLIKQIRMLLFNYGIHTYLETKPPSETSFVRESGETTIHETLESYKLVVSSNFTDRFYDLIGFGLDRKQNLSINNTSQWSELMPPVVKTLLKELKDTTDLSIAKMTKLGLAPNVLYGNRHRITKNRLAAFMSKISYEGNKAYDSLVRLLEYDWFNEVKSLDDSENEVYDFTLPTTHTFIGDCTVHANTNGVGGWYWSTMSQAEAGLNNFHPIVINWWDMDWAIEYTDALTKKHKRIAPRDGIRECRTKNEIEKYGPYWSPWLEEQYQALQAEGEAWKFEQEILARFVGSGNTILDKSVLAHISTTVEEPTMKVRDNQIYVHPVTGENVDLNFTFEEENQGFWIYRQPVLAKPAKMRGTQIIEYGTSAHAYVMGVDISTGKGRDFCAIEVFDVDTREQVAEFMARVLPRELAMYADMIGRFYNSALMVVERNNGGDIIIDELRYTYMYPRIWRKKDINDKPKPMSARRQRSRPLKVGTYGFMTTSSSKPSLNKLLVDFIRDTEDGWTIYSSRLLNQFHTYVRKRDRAGKDTNKTEAEEGVNNFDDLVMATGLAFVGANDAIVIDSSNLLPTGSNSEFKSSVGPTILTDISKVEVQQDISARGGPSLLMPMSLTPEDLPEIAAQRVLDAYTIQLGGIPISQGRPLVTPSKYFYEKK